MIGMMIEGWVLGVRSTDGTDSGSIHTPSTAPLSTTHTQIHTHTQCARENTLKKKKKARAWVTKTYTHTHNTQDTQTQDTHNPHLGLAEALLLVAPRGVRQVCRALAGHPDVVLEGEVLDLHIGQGPGWVWFVWGLR
jgi:hypothetical protein